ncbi:MAG: hypothetical protein ACTSRA_02175, partial [Promethearchaeota archaeon]
ILVHNTNANNNDTDSDGMPDGWEVDNSLDPLSDDSQQDPDDDGFNNLEEYQNGTNPHSKDGSSDDDSTTTNTAIPGYDPILIILALTVELMITVFVLMILKNRDFKIKI